MVAGPWLAETLKALRSPQGLDGADPGDALKGTLRPYQQVGVRWLYLLTKLGLGACLADDMGLGKTIQVLALLLLLKRESGAQSEAEPADRARFAAGQLGGGDRTIRAGPEDADRASVRWSGGRSQSTCGPIACADVDLAITTYGSLLRAAVDRRGSRGGWWSSTKRRPSRTPMPNRREP